MPYRWRIIVEKFRLTFNRFLKSPQVADMVRKTKGYWYNNPDVEETGKIK